MPTLTKEEKMNILSNAIDKGFDVTVTIHETTYDDAIELLKVFEGLPVEISHHDDSLHTWFWVNQFAYDDNFKASIHLK